MYGVNYEHQLLRLLCGKMRVIKEKVVILVALVEQRVSSTIHSLNHCPQDNSIGFDSTYPMDSDLSPGIAQSTL